VTEEIITTAAVQRAGFAAERVFGLLAFALSIAALVLLLLNLPTAIAQGPVLSWGWVSFSIAAAGLPQLISLVSSGRTRPSVIRLIWGVSALLLLVAYATAPVALGNSRLSGSLGLPWLVQLAVVAGCSAAVAWPTKYAIAYGVLLQIALFNLVRYVAEPFPGQAMGEAVEQLFVVTFFMCPAVALRKASQLLDQTIISAVLEAQASSTSELRRYARQRLEMIVHDRLIAALLSYASDVRPEQAIVEAQEALAAIDQARTVPLSQVERPPQKFAWELQAITTQFDPDAAFDHVVETSLPIPADVAEAVLEATSEALRNSTRHAPHERVATRQVRLEISDDGLEVVVLDDGDGFDLRGVNQARLGIRSGIEGRLRAVRGGDARVSSQVGYGTTVVMRWERP